MKKLKLLIAGLVTTAAGIFSVVNLTTPVSAVTCPEGSLRQKAGIAANTYAECNLPADGTEDSPSLFDTLKNVINVILGVLGIVTVIMIIIGGFTYITSQGDPNKTKKAKDTIMYGVIGLVIALLAFAIVNFVLANVFNGNSGDDTTDATTQQTNN